MGRGMLTPEIQERATELMGRPISVAELRLMPYLGYLMVNNERLDPRRVNGDEREILAKWRDEGRINRPGGMYVEISREFWDIINDLQWHAYIVAEGGNYEAA